MTIKARGGKQTLQLYRRVPKRYEAVEPRRFVWVSLHTDSRSAAESKASLAWAQMIEGWEAKLAGDSSDAEARFEAARNLAAVRGFRYLDAATVSKLPIEDLLQRVEAVTGAAAKPDFKDASAVLGGATVPPITISRSLELFWTLAADRTIGKSADQHRRWKNPYIKAIKNLIAFIGDKAIGQISGDDMLDFRQWWISAAPTIAMSAAGFRLPSDQPISDNERAWIDFLRLVSCDSDPAPTLRIVQAMRLMLAASPVVGIPD